MCKGENVLFAVCAIEVVLVIYSVFFSLVFETMELSSINIVQYNIALTSCNGLNSYTGELQDPAAVSAAVKDGLASVHFCQVVMQLCNELKSLNKMEERVSAPQGFYT